ncbi:MAG: D-aminoacyl-tRNA deacylase [Coraliomargarita sp.]
MRAVIQRVSRASVFVAGREASSIRRGMLLLLGVGREDGPEDIEWLAGKVCRARIWEDAEGRMNRSLEEVGGSVLVVSQFTLWGNLKKGSRPSYNRAAAPDVARALYEAFVLRLKEISGRPVPTGCFGEHMEVDLVNDGPVTLVLDSRQRDF